MITVIYTGPDCAILAGSYIYAGEARTVSPAQLAAAQISHPDGFVIVAGERRTGAAPEPPLEDDLPDDQPPTTDAPVSDAANGAAVAHTEPASAPAIVPTPQPAAPPRQPLPPQRPDHGRQGERRR